MKKLLSLAASVAFSVLALAPAAHADDLPQITPSLKKMLGGLPIAGMKNDVDKLIGSLKKTTCGGGLTGCYMTKSGKMQLYFFTSNSAQQTFLLVLHDKMALPTLLKPNVQKVFGGTSVVDPIISISTTDYVLTLAHMPADLQQIAANSYFNVPSMTFTAGVQLAARANVGGALMNTLKALNVPADQMTLRAGVVMPIPTDLAGGAGSGAGMADALHHGDTMKKAGASAAAPEAFVEFQPAPGLKIQMLEPAVVLSDATYFINNNLTFGYKGNARFTGTTKDFLLQFQTPLTPEGVMDLADFAFRMATPATFTLFDIGNVAFDMMMPDVAIAKSSGTAALNKYGGGYVGNIKQYSQPLKAASQALSVFQMTNPNPAPTYRFGDPAKPYPTTDAPFNILLLGPLADGGPRMYSAGNIRILGQTMGKMEVNIGKAGFQGTASEQMSLKLGPLGNAKIRMVATADISAAKQDVSLVGNLDGQTLLISLAGDTMTAAFSASCVNPFEIKTSVKIQESLDIAQVFSGQGGANVDPSKLGGCVGPALTAALNKIAGEYKSLGGYSASQATAALNKIASDAAAAAAQAAADAQKAADAAAAQAKAAADAAYKQTKDAARNLANSSTSSAMKEFNDAGNAISHAFGGKTKHSDANDRFDRSVFDWDYYYDTRGTTWGNTDIADYWNKHGYDDGMRASKEFDMAYYRVIHPKASEKDLLNTWLKDGINKCEQASADFSLKALQSRHPGRNCRDTYNWYYDQGGPASGLDGRP